MRFDYLLIFFLLPVGISIVSWFLVPSRFGSNRYLLLLFFAFSLFIPVLGSGIILLAVILLHLIKRHQAIHLISYCYYPPFQREHQVQPAAFGEGEAFVALHGDQAEISKRVEALATINSFAARMANKFNRQMLQSDNYELRLYAFAALNKQEREVNGYISDALELLEKAKTQKQQALIKKKLAYLYWELLYRNLVFEEQVNDILFKINNYLNEVEGIFQDDSELYVLEARLALFKKKYDKAETLFKKTIELRTPYNKILPYMAEMYFTLKQYDKLKECVTWSKTIDDIPSFAAIAKFWRPDD